MQDELSQFDKNQDCIFVQCPKGYTIIGTRSVFRNKLDEESKVIKNKVRLVARGYCNDPICWTLMNKILNIKGIIF